MVSNIIKDTDFDISNLTFSLCKKDNYGGRQVKILYKGVPYPILRLSHSMYGFGIQKYKKYKTDLDEGFQVVLSPYSEGYKPKGKGEMLFDEINGSLMKAASNFIYENIYEFSYGKRFDKLDKEFVMEFIKSEVKGLVYKKDENSKSYIYMKLLTNKSSDNKDVNDLKFSDIKTFFCDTKNKIINPEDIDTKHGKVFCDIMLSSLYVKSSQTTFQYRLDECVYVLGNPRSVRGRDYVDEYDKKESDDKELNSRLEGMFEE